MSATGRSHRTPSPASTTRGSGVRTPGRDRHGHELKEVSWTWPRGGGYRLDHLVVSAEIEVAECGYLHEWRRELKLSDHSPLVVEVGRVVAGGNGVGEGQR